MSVLTTATPTIGNNNAPQKLRPSFKVAKKANNRTAAWIMFAGAMLPSDIQFNIGGAKLTTGRVGILLLLLPAVIILLRKGRHRVAADIFAIMTGIWMIVAVTISDGTNSLPSAGAQSLELLGAYLIARAYFFSTPSLTSMIGTLKIVTTVVVTAGILDNVSGRLLVHDAAAGIFGVLPLQVGYRYGLARAASTFDHAILFGTFCSLLAAIFLYSQQRLLPKIGWVSLCLVGCFSSLSSIAILSIVIVFATYTYDSILASVRWRWKLFLAMILGGIAFLFLFSNNPMGWIISHLTLDPETGFYRILIWDAATIQISNYPWTGIGFREYGVWILDATVDCVWLEQSLRFGLPMAVLLFLTNYTALMPARSKHRNSMVGAVPAKLRTGFTLVLSMFMFIGLTVHFWNYLWIFWGLCIGVRASLREREIYATV